MAAAVPQSTTSTLNKIQYSTKKKKKKKKIVCNLAFINKKKKNKKKEKKDRHVVFMVGFFGVSFFGSSRGIASLPPKRCSGCPKRRRPYVWAPIGY